VERGKHAVPCGFGPLLYLGGRRHQPPAGRKACSTLDSPFDNPILRQNWRSPIRTGRPGLPLTD